MEEQEGWHLKAMGSIPLEEGKHRKQCTTFDIDQRTGIAPSVRVGVFSIAGP
jgi:hypothetical protein